MASPFGTYQNEASQDTEVVLHPNRRRPRLRLHRLPPLENIANDSFRTLLLNAVAWTAGLEVPTGGVPSRTPTKTDLGKLYEEGLRVGE